MVRDDTIFLVCQTSMVCQISWRKPPPVVVYTDRECYFVSWLCSLTNDVSWPDRSKIRFSLQLLLIRRLKCWGLLAGVVFGVFRPPQFMCIFSSWQGLQWCGCGSSIFPVRCFKYMKAFTLSSQIFGRFVKSPCCGGWDPEEGTV